MINEEIFFARYPSDSEAMASESLGYLADMFSRFKSSDTHILLPVAKIY